MSASNNKHLSLAVATTVAACSLATLLLWKKRRAELLPPNKDKVVIELLPIEQTLAKGGGGDNSMSTLTWFRGDYMKTSEILQERTAEILKQNPWLGGRVVKRNGTWLLVYDSASSVPIQDHFQVDTDTALPRDTPVTKLGSTLSHLLIKDGPTQPLLKVTILPAQDKDQAFAVIVCLSHIIADGATFYKIQNMLMFAEPVAPLIVERIPTTDKQQIEAMGGVKEYFILQSASFILNCVGGVLKAVTVGPKVESRVYLVDPEAMEIAKRLATNDATTPFVSCNDVITSWFLQCSGCTNGLMALNFRGRLDAHDHDHAGNYENVLFYRRADSLTPSLIRSSLTKQHFRRTVTSETPISFAEIAFGSVAIASNWSSFAKPPLIPGCKEEVHVPLYDMSSLLPSTMAVMIIFRVSETNKLGVMVSGTPDKLKRLEKAPFLKEWDYRV